MARLARWALLLIAAPLYAYSAYLGYIVLTGPLPSLDARGHLYLLVAMAPAVIWPFVPLCRMQWRAVAMLFAAIFVSYFSMHIGVRLSDHYIASILVYAGGFGGLCWIARYLLKIVRLSNSWDEGVEQCLASLVLVSFIWFLLKLAWHAGGLVGPYYAVAAPNQAMLVIATYTLLVSSALACLGYPPSRRIWLVQTMLFGAVLHFLAKGEVQVRWIAENLVFVMMVLGILSLRGAAKRTVPHGCGCEAAREKR